MSFSKKTANSKIRSYGIDPSLRITEIVERLETSYPGSAKELCALDYSNPFELLVATILSAQCTDKRVNSVTPKLFAAFEDVYAMASADPMAIEEIIRSTGFFRTKARNISGMSTELLARYGGEVPKEMEDLITLPGVGRKTANVVRSVAFGLPGLPVDTHVGRLSRRLGLSVHSDPVQVEFDLNELIAPKDRGAFSLRLILHGRAICEARSPRCAECMLLDLCPSGSADNKMERDPRHSVGVTRGVDRTKGSGGAKGVRGAHSA